MKLEDIVNKGEFIEEMLTLHYRFQRDGDISEFDKRANEIMRDYRLPGINTFSDLYKRVNTMVD